MLREDEDYSRGCLRFFRDEVTTEELANEYAANILKPAGTIKYQTFLMRRKIIGGWVVTHGVLHVALTFRYFWYYLTAWALVFNAITFSFILFCHHKNGDFGRKFYVKPEPLTAANVG